MNELGESGFYPIIRATRATPPSKCWLDQRNLPAYPGLSGGRRGLEGAKMGDRDRQDGPIDTPAMELASCQASLAFERTLISIDQYLMGAIRTSLALITFGFALVLFFHQVSGEIGVNLRTPARNFGVSLVALGTGLIVVGLLSHRRRFGELCDRMDELRQKRLLNDRRPARPSPVAAVALLLLLAGLMVMLGILVRMGPFG